MIYFFSFLAGGCIAFLSRKRGLTEVLVWVVLWATSMTVVRLALGSVIEEMML